MKHRKIWGALLYSYIYKGGGTGDVGSGLRAIDKSGDTN